MKKILNHIVTLLCLFLITSCLKQTESIAPFADIKTMSEIQRESMMTAAILASGNDKLSDSSKASVVLSNTDPTLFFLNLKYKFIDMDLYENTDVKNSFEQVGHSLLKVFAEIFLKIAGDRTIKLSDISFNLPDLNLDFNIIKSIAVKNVHIEFSKDVDDNANFSFIKSLSLTNAFGNRPLKLMYNKERVLCTNRCLDFEISNGEILEFVKNNKIITFKPALTITSFPETLDFKLDGEIELEIGLKLPF
jgi:uncharacterized ubiquitin-like protein YukD